MPVLQGVSQLAGIVPKIDETTQRAEQQANQSITELKNSVTTQQLQVAANQFARSKDPVVSVLGSTARGFLEKGNKEGAELALSTAHSLEQINALGKKYKNQAWAKNFRRFALSLASQSIARGYKLNDNWKYGAYVQLSTVQESIANASRLENMQRLSKRKNPFIRQNFPKIVKLYATGKTKQADRAMAALLFYDKTYNRKNAKILDGKQETMLAVQHAIEGNTQAEQTFRAGFERYHVAATSAELSGFLDEQYAGLKKAFGENKGLESLIAEAKKHLKARRLDKAEKSMEKFYKARNAFVEQKRAEQLEGMRGEVEATVKAIDQLEKQLYNYAKAFPSEIKKLLAKIEKLEAQAEVTHKTLTKTKGKELSEEEGKALQAQMKKFAQQREAVFSIVPTALVVMNSIQAEQQFGEALKVSSIEGPARNLSMKHGSKSLQYLRASLAALVRDGPTSKRARAAFQQAMNEKARVLALLKLRDVSLQKAGERLFDMKRQPEREFSFFQNASMKMYDRAATGRGLEADTWKLSQTLFNMESSIRQSDEKLFARGEVGLQQNIIKDSKILIAHYTREMRIRDWRVDRLEQSVKANGNELSKKIARAETINQVGKIAASFIHPAVMVATTAEMIAKEHRLTGEISWASTGMLAASAIAFRHTGLMRGLTGLGPTAATRVITGVELSLAGTLIVHGGATAIQAFKQGNWQQGALTLAMFALPFAYATVRTPIHRTVRGSYQQLTGNRILLRMQELERAGLPKGAKQPAAMRLQQSEAGIIELGPAQMKRTETVGKTQTKQPTEIRRIRLEERFHEKYWKAHTEDDVANAIAGSWTSGEILGPNFEAAITALAGRSKDVQARVRGVVRQRLSKALPEKKVDLAMRQFNVYMSRRGPLKMVSEYHPAVELGELNTQLARLGMKRSGKMPSELEKARGQILDQGANVKAHGTGKDGARALVNIMLDGNLEGAWYGSLEKYRGSFAGEQTAGYKGPIYVILNSSHPKMRGAERVPRGEGVHLAYLVPANEDRALITRALNRAHEKGMISNRERSELLAKLVTYDEFLKMQKTNPKAFQNPTAFRQARAALPMGKRQRRLERAEAVQRSSQVRTVVGGTKKGAGREAPKHVPTRRGVEPATAEAARLDKIKRQATLFKGDLARKKASYQKFLGATQKQQNKFIENLREAGEHELATSLVEFRSLTILENQLGLSPGRLSGGYTGSSNISEARAQVLVTLQRKTGIRIKIDTGADTEVFAHVFPNLYGLFSEGVLGRVGSILPPKSKVTGISYSIGLVGAFRVNIRTPKGKQVFFLKPQDARADRLGAELGKIADVPTPKTLTEIGGRTLESVGPSGKKQPWGIAESINQFEGMIRAGEREVAVTTTTAESLSTIQNNPKLFKILQEHPEVFGEELGYATTGTTAVGMWDGHEANLFAMLLRVSKKDAAFLESKGHKVFRDAEGAHVLRLGRIDTDTGGTFRAQITGGKYDFGNMFERVGGEDLRRVFGKLAQNQQRPVEQIITQLEPHILRGAERWSNEVGSRPEFRTAVESRFKAHDGQPAGLGSPLSPSDLTLMKQKRLAHDMPINGRKTARIDHTDGRSTFNADDATSTFYVFLADHGRGNNLKKTWDNILGRSKAALERQAEAAGKAPTTPGKRGARAAQ